jgi:hypothetical protein
LTNAKPNVNPEDINTESAQTDSTENIKPVEHQLKFTAVSMKNLSQGQPKRDWKKEKTISLGELDAEPVSIHLYIELGNENSAYAFLEHKGNFTISEMLQILTV